MNDDTNPLIFVAHAILSIKGEEETEPDQMNGIEGLQGKVIISAL